jgi:DNA-binding transcriptional LysR family regulator
MSMTRINLPMAARKRNDKILRLIVSRNDKLSAMHVTLEQARALDALATHGTLQAAGKALHRVHTAVLYAVRGLQAQSGLLLLDRKGYRTKLTPEGEKVLEHCRRLLAAERELVAACARMRSGWEPQLKVVFDGIFSSAPILAVLGALRKQGAPTRIQVSVDHLDGVEQRFVAEDAQLMISVLPTTLKPMVQVRLPGLSARLVAHRRHPLAKTAAPAALEALAGHVFLTVRGSDPRLQLSTSELEQSSTVQLSDFHAKKAAILQGIGYGWLPEWIMARELARGELVTLKLRRGSTHAFEPRLYHRPGQLGNAAMRLLEALRSAGKVAPVPRGA